jgi:hypothetical protein
VAAQSPPFLFRSVDPFLSAGSLDLGAIPVLLPRASHAPPPSSWLRNGIHKAVHLPVVGERVPVPEFAVLANREYMIDTPAPPASAEWQIGGYAS